MRRSLLLLVVLVGACSSGSPSAGGPHPTTPAATRTTAPATHPATHPAYAVTTLSAATTFLSADGNLACDIESAYARCDPKTRDWPLPPQPSDCASGWGHGIELQAGTKASFFCGSDHISATRPLAAGHAYQVGFLECDAVSATTVSCHGTADAHGFTISKAKYSLT
jgi:hypothetical protein